MPAIAPRGGLKPARCPWLLCQLQDLAGHFTDQAVALYRLLDHQPQYRGVSLPTSIGPPGSASVIAMPATIGARRSTSHSLSVKSALWS